MPQVQIVDAFLTDDGKEVSLSLMRADGMFTVAVVKVDRLTIWNEHAMLPAAVKTTLERRKSDGP